MPIAFDAATDGGNNGGASTSLTFSHACSGSDRLLIVIVAGDSFGGADDVTGVTYGGVPMELVGKRAPAASNRWNYLYLLENPASGANNVVVSASSTHYLLAGAASYTGAAQTGQPDASTTNDGGGSVTSLTTSVTVVAADSWLVCGENAYTGNNPPAAGTGTTRRTFDAPFGGWGLFDSNGAVAAGSRSLQTTRPESVNTITHVMASIAPAGGGGGPTPRPADLLLLGVGS